MKFLNRIFLIFIVLITILIYYRFENKKINYVSINITESETYSDFFVQKIKNVGTYNRIIESKSLSEELLKDINNNIIINKGVTIQNILNEASIITVMLNSKEIYETKSYNELETIYNNINQILTKIVKISNGKIIFLGFYNIYDNDELDNKIIYVNRKIENICKKYKIEYIDLYNLFKNKKYLFYLNEKNLPNKDANIMISNAILKKYDKKYD